MAQYVLISLPYREKRKDSELSKTKQSFLSFTQSVCCFHSSVSHGLSAAFTPVCPALRQNCYPDAMCTGLCLPASCCIQSKLGQALKDLGMPLSSLTTRDIPCFPSCVLSAVRFQIRWWAALAASRNLDRVSVCGGSLTVDGHACLQSLCSEQLKNFPFWPLTEQCQNPVGFTSISCFQSVVPGASSICGSLPCRRGLGRL